MISPQPRLACATLLLILALAASLSTPLEADPPAVYAITGARIYPVSSPPIPKGTVVIRDGLIESVGASVRVPPDARVIDGSGLSVYPGLIDAGSDLGLPATAASTGQGGPGGGPGGVRAGPVPAASSPEENALMRSHIRVADTITDGGSRAEAARAAGFTTVLTVPNRGIFAGQSALVNLNGDRDTMVLKSPVAMHVRLSSSGARQYPVSLMGMYAYLRQGLLDARRHDESWTLYNRNVRSLRRPATNQSLDALVPVVQRKMTVVVPASSAAEMQRALRLADEMEIRAILSGGTEGWKIASTLKEKQIPLLLSVRFPERDRDPDPDAEEALRVIQRRLDAPRNAGELHKAGIKFALYSDGLDPAQFVRNIGRAVKAGLPPEVALRSLTLTPAEIFGVAEQTGSIEKGKIANLVVADGDPLAERTRVRHVFVDGRRFEGPPEAARPLTAPQVNLTGKWTGTIDAPSGKANVSLDLMQTGNSLTGTITSAMTTSAVTEGSVSGRDFRFKAQVRLGETDVSMTFTGTAEMNALKGKVMLENQDVDFNATRMPGGTP